MSSHGAGIWERPKSTSGFPTKEALREYLQEVEDDEHFKEAVIELYLDDRISFDVLKEFIGRQDAEAVQASKAILEQGDELADL